MATKLSVRDVPVGGKLAFSCVSILTCLWRLPTARSAMIRASGLRSHNSSPGGTGRRGRPLLAYHWPSGREARDPAASLRPVAERMSALLGQPVTFVEDCVGRQAGQAVNAMQAGEVILLENLRFHAGEEANDRAFAQELAALADVYVDDAFGTAHRAHASTEGVTHFLPSAAGLLMERGSIPRPCGRVCRASLRRDYRRGEDLWQAGSAAASRDVS